MILFRISDVLMLGIAATVVTATYLDKHETQKLYSKIQHIERQIESKKNTLNLLRADWALMTQPDRLQQLAQKYYDQLNLQETHAEQIVQLKNLPERKDIIRDIIKSNLSSDENRKRIESSLPFSQKEVKE